LSWRQRRTEPASVGHIDQYRFSVEGDEQGVTAVFHGDIRNRPAPQQLGPAGHPYGLRIDLEDGVDHIVGIGDPH
jgi:hypothetical protein